MSSPLVLGAQQKHAEPINCKKEFKGESGINIRQAL